jgi:hypothetical protein
MIGTSVRPYDIRHRKPHMAISVTFRPRISAQCCIGITVHNIPTVAVGRVRLTPHAALNCP